MQRGTIDQLPSGRYRARFSLPNGKRRARTFLTKTSAKAWLNESITDLSRGELTDPTAGARTLDHYANVWLGARVNVRASTLATDRAMIAHALRVLGDIPVAKIAKVHIEGLVRTASETLAPSSVRHVHRTTAAVLEVAVEDRAVPRNVARGVKLPRDEREELITLSPAEVHALAVVIPPRYTALVRLAAATGLRFGELAGLKVEDINWLGRKLTVSRQRLRTGELAPPKTRASQRTISLDSGTVETLSVHVSEFGAPGGFLFTSPDGEALSYGNFRTRVWLPAVRAIDRPGLSFHDLRHSHAAHLIAAGVHAKTIQARLGHASIRITLDTYGHLMAGVDEDAADRIGLVLDRALAV